MRSTPWFRPCGNRVGRWYHRVDAAIEDVLDLGGRQLCPHGAVVFERLAISETAEPRQPFSTQEHRLAEFMDGEAVVAFQPDGCDVILGRFEDEDDGADLALV